MKHDFSELKLDGVTRRFAGAGGKAFNALSEMTLTIRRGEFIALLGPSGCGKSTALNCIAGLMPLSDGSIWLDDQRIDTLPPEKRGFGMVFQNYALFPHMSVVRNVGFGLRMRGIPAAEVATRVDRALELVQLTGQEHKLPGQLSGGQQQRVAIARAIVIEPPLILMDEPPANLDVARFMGYRNVVEFGVEREDGQRIVLARGGVRMHGTPKQPIASGPAFVAMRPDDIMVGEGPDGLNTLVGRVDVVEYGGRDSLVDVITSDGTRLHVRTHVAVAVGDNIRLHVPPERALVYPG